MKATTKAHRFRTVAIGAACAALLAGGAGVATAAPASTPNVAAASVSAPSPKAKASITVKANTMSVKPGQTVTLTGKTKGIAAGSKLTVQQMDKGKWTTLHASTTVNHDSSYRVRVNLIKKGTEMLRVTDGKTVSPTVTITVH
ncbi:hypothetical protein [Actinacidiphila oryziradicis]|jgi:Rieske Fe-S protein|uniref:Bacterial Ig domain-containing protein n=1 Tax=Actinacidiphila oryziradicis TaxID=2571141 RepID=A0A4V5MWH1_9ACTN|nr:hypothetical protein [Actinacidiphila oryziradicis]TJZ95838.1 hypothetical protein FCI23_51800 [Actinacidiphila oryziradicis]